MSTDPMAIPVPAPEPSAQISPVGRVIGMFFSPKPTFEDIVRKPTWVFPVVLVLALSLIAVTALNMHFDWRAYMTQQIEKNPAAASLSADQKQQRVEAGAKFAPISSFVAGPIAPILGLLVISLILMVLYNLMAGAGADFKTSFSIVSHSILPASIVSTVLFVVVLLLKPVGTFDLDNPVATNLAAFLPEDSSKWLMALGKNIDLLEIWKILLIGIGFAAVNPRKLKGAKPFTIVFGAFLVYVILRVGIAFAFS